MGRSSRVHHTEVTEITKGHKGLQQSSASCLVAIQSLPVDAQVTLCFHKLRDLCDLRCDALLNSTSIPLYNFAGDLSIVSLILDNCSLSNNRVGHIRQISNSRS